MRRFSLMISILASLLLVTVSVAQTTTGRIVGTVRDSSGAMIPGVGITVRNPATGLVRSVATAEQGNFSVPLLPPAVYEVEASLSGFRKEIRRGVTLQVDNVVTVDFVLQVGGVSEVLDVTADAPLVQSETATLGQVMDARTVEDLPLNQRHFMALTTLTAGIQPSVEGSNLSNQNLSFHAMGAREVDNNFLFDGVDNNDTGNSQLVIVPSIDAIQEFKIQSSTFGAEFGRAAGAVVNIVTKPGSNDFHFTAFEFLRNDVFDARNFFASSKQPYKRNQFGVVVSGPIVKNRSFWMFNYEGNRIRQTQTSLATVPSLAFRNGDFSSFSGTLKDPVTGLPFANNQIPANRFSSIGKGIVDFYPVPNRDGSNNYETSANNLEDTDIITTRIDHRFNDNHSVYGRFSWQNAYQESPEFQAGVQLPNFGAVFFQPIGRNVALNDTIVISPTIVNEARVGFNRLIGGIYETLYGQDLAGKLGLKGVQSQLKPRGVDDCNKDTRCKTGSNLGFPRVDVSGYSRQRGTYSPQLRYGDTWHYFDMLAITKGTHQMKTGGEYRAMSMNLYFDNIPNGQFRFDGRYSGNAVADLLMGYAASTSRYVGDGQAYQRSKAASLFFQDDWKVTRQLTLNLGVRWELQTPPIAAGAPVTVNPSDFNDLSAFDRNTGEIVIGGKSGVQTYVDPLNPGQVIQVPGGADRGIPRGLYITDYNDIAPRFGFAWSPEITGMVIRGGYGVFYVPVISAATWTHRGLAYPFVIPQSLNQNAANPVLTLEDPFPGGSGAIIVRAVDRNVRTGYMQQYNLGIQHAVGSNMVLDVSYAGSKGTKLTNTPDINQAVLGSGSINARRLYPQWGSILERENSGGSSYNALQTRFERRFSQGLTFITSYTWSHSIDDGSGSTGVAGGGYQNSHDLRSERGDSVFDVRHRLVQSYTYELPIGNGHALLHDASGVAQALLGGWQLSGITTFATGQSFTPQVAGDVSNTGNSFVRPNLVGDPMLDDRTSEHWFNTSAFAVPAANTFGSLGRNTLKAPGINNWDLTMMKTFQIGDHQNLQFRAELFNFLNHPNFSVPNNEVTSSAFGTITRAKDGRQIQFGLKFNY